MTHTLSELPLLTQLKLHSPHGPAQPPAEERPRSDVSRSDKKDARSFRTRMPVNRSRGRYPPG